jgi:hypothetical protein
MYLQEKGRLGRRGDGAESVWALRPFSTQHPSRGRPSCPFVDDQPALLLGAFLGNILTHRKYRQREPSVWDILERRLKEQKAKPPRTLTST